MKNFESYLKTILDKSQYGTIPIQMNDLEIPEPIARQLKAKGLITFKSVCDNSSFIILTDFGIDYFDRKKAEIKQILIRNMFNFAMAIFSAICGSVATLLIQQLFIK